MHEAQLFIGFAKVTLWSMIIGIVLSVIDRVRNRK